MEILSFEDFELSKSFIPVGIGTAALIELTPVVNWLWEFAVLMTIEARCVDMIFYVPFFVFTN